MKNNRPNYLSKVIGCLLYNDMQGKMKPMFLIIVSVLLTPLYSFSQVTIAFDVNNQPVVFGVSRLEAAFKMINQPVHKIKQGPGNKDADITIRVMSDNRLSSLQKEGFEISSNNHKIVITANDAAGAMYGTLDLAEQIKMGKNPKNIPYKKINPHFSVRALKFNLPWSSYRVGPSMDLHTDVCRDLSFWKKYIDQMADNRFNVLSLWNVHPFAYMVKPKNFPGANDFTDKEMAEWKYFWSSIFRMCKNRAIDPFIVNWNIAVTPEFAKKYGVKERNDTAEIVKRYTREVITQVINEYPDLAGIGITLADWMSNFSGKNSTLPEMTSKDREDWIEQTVVAGIKAADRPVRFIHRSVLSSDPAAMRKVIDNAVLTDTTLVEIKFNWSHGHSTPALALTHDSHSGKVDAGYWDPMPTNFRVQWMVRNEDFFILRWGQPDFIRKHIAQNSEAFVNGYFVGSEGYIPAKEYSHLENGHKTWQYAFEKQWLFYQLWGRLLYDPSTPDHVFESAFNSRYGNNKGEQLLKAYAAASKMPLKLASFHGSTWDYTLYSEGFLAPFASNGGLHDTVSSFISIDELIDHPVLDPDYVSIPDYVKLMNEKKQIPEGKLTPLALAASLETDGKTVLKLVNKLRPGSSPTLNCELDDLETWAYLSLYFEKKIKAGIFLNTYRTNGDILQQQKAVQLLGDCVKDWKQISRITSAHYREVPYVDDHSSGGIAYKDALRFSWSKYLPQVERDILLAKEKR